MLLILIFTMMANLPNASTIEPLSPGKGPRTEDLIIRYYSNVKDAYLALKAGDIDIIGSEIHGYIEPIPANPIDDYVWIASFGPDNLDNNNLPGRYVGNDYSYNGFGVPYWTGDFSLDYPFTSVNEINVTCLGFTPDNYTFTLSEGVDYLVHADEDLIELLNPVDVPVINEHWKDGVNNTLNGMPSINYVASGIESVYVDMNNGTSRFGQNFGYAMPPPSEWWYDPDWTWELEGWWALGWFPGAWNWPAGSDWWINYTAASYLTIDYNAENPQPGMDILVDAMNDPNICLGPVGDRGKYEFDINNNYICPLFPGLRSPTNFLNFRRGLAFLVDKWLVVNTFCGGFANRIDQPIAYQHKGWRNQSYWYEDGTYPYEYSPVQAAALFDAAGFVQGTTANPDYDPGKPGSAAFLRIHPDTGVTMGLLEVCVRSDDARRLEAGRALCEELRIAGIPVNQIEAPSAVLYPKVMVNFEYHVYAGRWSLGRFPAVSAYGLYHSSQYMSGGSNYVTGDDSLGNPMYPVLDSYLYTARFPADYSEAQSAARKAFGEIVEQCITIELFSAASYWAWSDKLLGVVNMEGIGPINSYTFMNAYRYDIVNGRPTPTNQPIRLGLCASPNAMNKIYSRSYYDYQCLDRMDLYAGIDVTPYDQSVDQPGYILDWTVDTWFDPEDSLTKSKISQTYREDAWFVEPVTGTQLENVNITHHYASIWYEYQLTDAWNHNSVADIKTLRITSPHSLEFYWNLPGYWNTYMGTTSIKSFNWWSKGTLSQTVTETLTADAVTGYVSCTEPVFWVVNAESGGTPLVLGTDYDIYKDPDGPHNADIRIINGAYLGTSIDLTYMATDDAVGGTPGDLPWQDAFEGAGMYYATDFVSGVGGYITLKRNPFYWMETPTLGEIDFVINPSGEQKVTVVDITIAASAYGSQGISVPSISWFSGADLFPFGGFIDLFDMMVVYNAYGNGHPPVGHNVTLVDITPLQTEVTSGTLVPISITVANPGDYTETFNANVCVNRTKVASVEVTLSSGEGTTIIVTWDTSCFQGNYTISAYVGPVDYEEDMWDNILIDNTVEVTPVQYTITVEEEGQEYNLEIESDTTLTYIIATANSLHFGATGPSGQTAYVNSTVPIGLNTTAIEVFVDNVELTYPPFPIITTNGTHYFVYFEITLSTHDLIIRLTPPEVVVTDVSSAKTAVGQGYTSSINMTVHNQGNYTKTFNATLFADQDSIIIGDEIAMRMLNVTLTSGNSTTITFTFNTTSLAKGNYTLCGVVDDSMVDGWVFVTIPGDVDMDRDVDIFDIVAMVGSYGSEIGDPEYEPNYDLDSDGDIDIFDIVAAVGHYLESW